MLGLINLLLIGFLCYLAITTWMVVSRLRNPPRRTYAGAVARNQPGDPSEASPARAFREFSISWRGIALPAWDIEGELADDPMAPVIICTPGWGESKLGVLPRMDALAPLAARIIAWDPQGLGDAPGECNLGTLADTEALIALIETISPRLLSLGGMGLQPISTTSTASDTAPALEPPPPIHDVNDALPRPILLLGWSMGAGISLHAAALLAERGRPALAVIAEAPYRHAATPVVNFLALVRMPHKLQRPLAMWWLGWRLRRSLDWRSFDRASFAARIACPLLVLHGTLDEICPIDDGRQIAAAAPRSLLIAVEGAMHNNLWTQEPYRTQCTRAIADFIPAARASTRLG
jgi:pimeloyl-ACP methyl ester carboxylesterase